MKKIVVSLFDGGSMGQQALKEMGITYDTYMASEIDPPAISITMKNFPKTKQLGDVSKIVSKDLGKVFLLMGGSPCGDLSLCGNMKGMVDIKNRKIKSLEQYLVLKSKGVKFTGQSYLFWEFLRILRETKPKYFLLENVKMKKEWEDLITKELGVIPIRINSSLVSAQNRDRLYWTNLPNVTIPQDKGIIISDVIPDAIGGYGERGKKDKTTGKYVYKGTTRKDGKSNTLCTGIGNTGFVTLHGNTHRKLTVNEFEKLQTLPVDYTKVDGLCMTKRLHVIGNGWTVNVIKHIFKGLKKKIQG